MIEILPIKLIYCYFLIITIFLYEIGDLILHFHYLCFTYYKV